MLLDLHYPPDPNSKACLVLDAIANAYENRKQMFTNKIDKNSIQVFWGLANNNAIKIKQCKDNNIPFIFTDMPYWNRWTKHDVSWSKNNAHWRIIPNNFHITCVEDFKNNRAKELGIVLNEFKSNGEHILICPSSATLTKFITGKSDQQWAHEVAEQCSKMYKDKLIRIRYKPRKNGTSGPDVEKISVNEDLDNCWATVTLSSIVGVESLVNGVQNIFTHKNVSATNSVGTFIQDKVVYKNREKWINTLANYQFNLSEIKQQKIGHIIENALCLHNR